MASNKQIKLQKTQKQKGNPDNWSQTTVQMISNI